MKVGGGCAPSLVGRRKRSDKARARGQTERRRRRSILWRDEMSDLSCKIYGCDYTAGETDCTKFSMPLVDKENLLPQDGNDNIALPSLGSFGSVNGEDFGAENSARCADAVADNVAHSLPSLLSQPEGLITDSSAEEGFVMGGFLHNSPPSILADTASFQISFNGSSKEFACASLQDLAPGEVRCRVCEAFGLPPRQDRAPLVLRHQGEGFIMPFGPALPAGVNFDLVCVDGPAAPPCRLGQPADAAAGPAGEIGRAAGRERVYGDV